MQHRSYFFLMNEHIVSLEMLLGATVRGFPLGLGIPLQVCFVGVEVGRSVNRELQEHHHHHQRRSSSVHADALPELVGCQRWALAPKVHFDIFRGVIYSF